MHTYMFIACNKLAPITSSKPTTVYLGKLLTYKFYLYYIQVATTLLQGLIRPRGYPGRLCLHPLPPCTQRR